MLDKIKEKAGYIISLVASVLIGLTLLVSGTGKILGVEETPAQVVDFISNFLPGIFITPATLDFLFYIFVPLIIPWTELILGACLLIGFLPRLMAVLCLPLLIAFMGTNLWSIMQGGYATCASCFGIWEKYFGSLTSVQSLVYDLVLFAFAIVIIVLHSGGFLSSRKWLAKGEKFDAATLKPKIRVFGRQLRNLGPKAMAYLNLTVKKAKEHPRIALSTGICLLILIACGITAVSISPAIPKNGATVEVLVVSDISVSEISETSAVISWMTDKPTISSVQAYAEDGVFTVTVTDEDQVTAHRLLVGGLSPDTAYHFKILLDDNRVLSEGRSFTTIAAITSPFMVSDVRVSWITESSATITWITNRPAISEVEYWIYGSKDHLEAAKDELTTNHNVNLVALKPDAIYHYQVKSMDASGNQATSTQIIMSTQIGKQAPDFTLNSLDGRAITLSDYRGKLVLLDFWLWSCSACREKMTIIQKAYARIPTEKIAILSIHPKVKESIIQMHVEDAGLTVPVLLDSEGVASDLYKVPVLPTTFLIDGDGIIRLIDPEFNNAEELENIFTTLLKGT